MSKPDSCYCNCHQATSSRINCEHCRSAAPKDSLNSNGLSQILKMAFTNVTVKPHQNLNEAAAESLLPHVLDWHTKEVEKAKTEAQLSILRGFRRRDFVRDDFYEHAIIERIHKLQKGDS